MSRPEPDMKAAKTNLSIDLGLVQKHFEEHFVWLGHSMLPALPAQVMSPTVLPADVGFSDFYGDSCDMPSGEGEQGCVPVCGPGEGKQHEGGPDPEDFVECGSDTECDTRPAKRARVDLRCRETMERTW